MRFESLMDAARYIKQNNYTNMALITDIAYKISKSIENNSTAFNLKFEYI